MLSESFGKLCVSYKEEIVTTPVSRKPFETDNEYHKPLYAMVNLVVAQQQAFVDFIHGNDDDDAESV